MDFRKAIKRVIQDLQANYQNQHFSDISTLIQTQKHLELLQ